MNLHRRIGWLFLVALAPAVFGQTDIRGIYIYTNDVSQISNATASQLTQSFSLPGVDGVAINISWSAIEPSMGQYSFDLLDQWIGKAVALGKKIDLVIPAGDATPAWLFQAPPLGAGAVQLNFTISPHAGATGMCDTDIIAPPWDAAFLSQFDAMLAAVSAHLKNAGTYNAITLLRLTGINRTSEELRLPAETPQSTGLSCVTDAISIWQQAGYRPSLLLQAWNTLLASFNKSFPDKPFAVSLITSNPFPPIDETGAKIKGPLPDENAPLLSAASALLPGRLVAQVDFLMPGEVAAPLVTNSAQNLGTMAAFQTNEYLGGKGAACSEPVTNPTPCTDATYLTLLDTGVFPLGQSNPLRSQYIEVFHDNATAFPDDILTAHFQLLPPSISVVANAEGQAPLIAPNTWIDIQGAGLSLTGDTRVWAAPDFVNNQMPTQLDSISATVNGKPAYVFYISPSQINLLTPPDPIAGPVNVQVTNNGIPTANFTANAQALSPSFFIFGAGPYIAARHADFTLLGPASLYPGATTPAKPGEIVLLYANGFGATSTPVTPGSLNQSGSLPVMPVIKVGGIDATVQFAGLTSPGLYQFNVALPQNLNDGDYTVTAGYGGMTTQTGAMISIRK